MRALIRAVMTAMAMAAAAGSALAASHHGGGSRVTTVYVPGRAPVYFGTPAHIALSIDAAKPESGTLEPGAVIGVRTAHVEEAVVLTEPLNDNGIQIDAGTVLVKVVFEPKVLARMSLGASPTYWCSMRQMPPLHGPTQDCLSDLKHTGKLDAYTPAYVADTGAPFSVVKIGGGRPIAPVAYRPARAEELPSIQFGYRFCSGQGDGVTIPLRFDTVIAKSDTGWVGSGAPCPFGDWPDLGDRTVQTVDQLKIKLSPGTPIRYEILSALPAGPLGPVHPSESIRPRGAQVAVADRLLEARSGPALRPEGAGKPVTGPVAHGGDVVLVTVKHGVTGALRYPVRFGGLLNARQLEAGHYMFGVPTISTFDPYDFGSMSWCAPEVKPGTPIEISTVCFSNDGISTYWVPMGNRLAVLALSHTVGEVGVSGGVSVERKPMAFPEEMTMAYVFDHWVTEPSTPGRRVICAQFGVEIRVQGVMTPIDHLQACPSPDGFRFALLGGVMSVTPVDREGHPKALSLTAGSDDDIQELMKGIDTNRAEIAVVSPLVGGAPLPISGRFKSELPAPPPLKILPSRPGPAPPVVAPPATGLHPAPAPVVAPTSAPAVP